MSAENSTRDPALEELPPGYEREEDILGAEPPRGARGSLWAALGGLLVGVALTLLLVLDPLGISPLPSWLGSDSGDAAGPAATAELHTCGMHPQVLQEGPGSCPICGMDLVPAAAPGEAEAGSAAALASHPSHDAAHHHDHGHDHGQGAEAGGEALWTCPMHPQVIEGDPGSCPICGMDLVEVILEDAPGGTSGISPSAPAESLDERPAVHLDAGLAQAMNVRTERARREVLERRLDAVGYLEYDQERMVTVTTKYSGWVETVYVHYVGERVSQGQPLFEVYSPDLVQTQRELLDAQAYARSLANAPQEVRQRAQELVTAARTRLSYWDVGEEQVRQLEQGGEVLRTVTVRSPASGVVMKKVSGLEGMAVRPGLELFHIADLATLWLSVELFETQIPWVREGSTAEVRLTYFPGEVFTGRVRFLAPELTEATRTLPVKLAVPNADGRLRPGMYADVSFLAASGGGTSGGGTSGDGGAGMGSDATVTVPLESVLRTGARNVVVVREAGTGGAPDTYIPRSVTLGVESASRVQILSGVAEGEEVVTSAQFLLDSESSLREAMAKLIQQRSGGQPHAH
ncbi:MAG: efflux RND transporter periplasmic adaptor subunit [Acidobacteriota bacterium]